MPNSFTDSKKRITPPTKVKDPGMRIGVPKPKGVKDSYKKKNVLGPPVKAGGGSKPKKSGGRWRGPNKGAPAARGGNTPAKAGQSSAPRNRAANVQARMEKRSGKSMADWGAKRTARYENRASKGQGQLARKPGRGNKGPGKPSVSKSPQSGRRAKLAGGIRGGSGGGKRAKFGSKGPTMSKRMSGGSNLRKAGGALGSKMGSKGGGKRPSGGRSASRMNRKPMAR